MVILDGLRNLFRPKYTYVYGGDYGVSVANMNAAELYKTQPNLRAVISFLAGQVYLFSKLLSWDEILSNFYRR